jgi:hypothetical protein
LIDLALTSHYLCSNTTTCMRKILFVLMLFLLVQSGKVFAQDTLPKISIKAISNKVVVSWRNEYLKTVTVINIQRSTDSIRNFFTIATILNPLSEDNGFVDTKPISGKCFYRVFIAFEGGSYVFSKSYRKPQSADKIFETPEIITPVKHPVVKAPTVNKVTTVKILPAKKDSDVIEKPVVIVAPKEKDVILTEADLTLLKRLPKAIVIIDAVNIKHTQIAGITAITLIRQRLDIDINRDSRDAKRMHVAIRRDSTDLIARLPFTPSKFINIGKDNDVVIDLPLYLTKKYSIKFYAEKDSAVLFEISKINEPYLILEKVNFKHSGWFRYHLYSNNILVEKYKIYIAIDDKTVPMVKEKADLTKDR